MVNIILKILSIIGIPKIIEWIFALFDKSKLKILSLNPARDIKIYKEVNGKWTRVFVNLHIEYYGRKPAEECYAILRVLRKPKKVDHL